MKKLPKQKKNEKNPDLSFNHDKSVRFRKRIQEDKESSQELEAYLKDDTDGTTIGLRELPPQTPTL